MANDFAEVSGEIPLGLISDLVLVSEKNHPMLQKHLVDKVNFLFRHFAVDEYTTQFGSKSYRNWKGLEGRLLPNDCTIWHFKSPPLSDYL
ncbi:hypothetical protein D3C85_1358190 [compost metagenome]